MRCPRCGRFIKVQIKEQGGEVETVSVCASCGEINLSAEKSKERTGNAFEDAKIFLTRARAAFDNTKIFLLVAAIVFAGVSAFLYFKYDEGLDVIAGLEENLLSLDAQYTELVENYVILLNNSDTLREFYDNTRSNYNELQIMYQDLRQEYSDLHGLHNGSIQENIELMDQISQLNVEKEAIQKELDDTLSFLKSTVIENNSSYVIPPGGNMTIAYDIVYAGYIEVNFTSTTDVFLWVGSPVSEAVYYSRFPVFPRTAFNGTFIVPVSNAVFLFIENTNLELSGVIVITKS